MFLDMIQVNSISGKRITVTSGVDTTSAQLLSFFVGKVPVVALVKYTVGERTTRPDGEEISL
jgi:hypothetical protein